MRGSYSVGGLVGESYYSKITDSYWDAQTSGRSNACGYGNCAGAAGRTTAEMTTQSTFAG